MARKNGLSINDPNTIAIIRKYLSGAKLTSTEKATIAGLVRMYPSLFTSGAAQKLASGSAANGGVNVNVSSVQTNPYTARSQYNQRRSTGQSTGRSASFGQVVSPGGFKSSGRDSESVARRSGNMTPDAVLQNVKKTYTEVPGNYKGNPGNRKSWNDAQKVEDGGYEIGGKKYSADQVDWIIKRGMSGATMNWKEQAIYDKVVNDQMAEAKKQKDEKIADENFAKEEFKRLKEDEADKLKRQRDLADWKAKEEFKAKADAEENATKSAEDVRRDNLKRASDSIKAGTHEYTKDQLDKMGEMQNEIDRISFDETMDDAAKDKSIAALRSQIERIRLNPHEKIVPEKSIEDRYNETYVNENGVRMAQDDKGKWYTVYNPKDNEAEKKSYEREEARKYREQERRDNWLDARAAEYMKDRKEKDDTGAEVTVKGLPYDQALEQAKKDMAIRFADETPVSEEVVVEEPVVEETIVEEPISNQPTNTGNSNKWDSFFKKPKAEQPVEQTQGEASVEICPVCGAELNQFGVCPLCGYPDERLVEEWRTRNEMTEE